MKLMKLEIVTPFGITYDADVKQVTLPGAEGEFGVLPGHATLVSLLTAGVITVETANSEKFDVAVNAGYVKVDESKVSCIVDGAVSLTPGDTEISRKIEEAKELLKGAETSHAVISAAVTRVENIGKSY